MTSHSDIVFVVSEARESVAEAMQDLAHRCKTEMDAVAQAVRREHGVDCAFTASHTVTAGTGRREVEATSMSQAFRGKATAEFPVYQASALIIATYSTDFLQLL